MKWLQRGAFHKCSYADRYPETWFRLQMLDLGIPEANLSMIETVDALLDHIDALDRRIDALEIEKDLT